MKAPRLTPRWERDVIGRYIDEGVLERTPPPCGERHRGNWWPDGEVFKCRLCHAPAEPPRLPSFR